MTIPTKTHKPVIGLSGGIGSGKSLVAKQLASLGSAVIDADVLAKQALDEPQVRQQLTQWWGQQILNKEGQVDRQAVGRIVFDDADQLRRLEQLVHPLVHQARHQLRQRYQQDADTVAIVEDCPLLFETGLDKQCDKVIFVKSSRENRLRRLVANRGWSDQELARREKNQIKLDIKAQQADYIVVNDAGEDECLSQVRRVLSQILQDQP